MKAKKKSSPKNGKSKRSSKKKYGSVGAPSWGRVKGRDEYGGKKYD